MLPSYTEDQKAMILKTEPWIQAISALSEMLNAFVPSNTVPNLTEEQSKATSFAHAVLNGNRQAEAVEMWQRIIDPLEHGDVWCDDDNCQGCHVHLSKVAALLMHQWFEVDSPRAQAAFSSDVLRSLWTALLDATRGKVSDEEVRKAIERVSLQLFATAEALDAGPASGEPK